MNTTGVCLNCDQFFVTYYPDNTMHECCDYRSARTGDQEIRGMEVCPKTGRINLHGQLQLSTFW